MSLRVLHTIPQREDLGKAHRMLREAVIPQLVRGLLATVDFNEIDFTDGPTAIHTEHFCHWRASQSFFENAEITSTILIDEAGYLFIEETHVVPGWHVLQDEREKYTKPRELLNLEDVSLDGLIKIADILSILATVWK